MAHDESLPGVAAIARDTSRSWTHGALPEAELPRLDSLVERGLAEGALAVGFGIEYTPAASREEILRLFRVAARHGVSCFVRSEEHTSELQSRLHLVCRLLLEKKKKKKS